MLWTEEAIEVLRTLALQGQSARTIAEALGAPSRSAVIGKANRIGIKLNGGGAAGAERPREASGAPIRRPRRPVAAGRALVATLPREPRSPSWIFAQAEVGDMLRVGFEDVAETNCRWPVGDPLSEDFVYCGLPPARGRSYCAGHCRMAYQPPKGARDAVGRTCARLPAGPSPGDGASILAFPAPASDAAASASLSDEAPRTALAAGQVA